VSEPFEFTLVRRVALSPAALGSIVTLILFVAICSAYGASGIAVVAGAAETGWTLSAQAHASLLASVLLGYGVGAAKHMAGKAGAWRMSDLARSRWSGAAGVLCGAALSALLIADIVALEPDRSMFNAGEVALNIAFLALFWAVGRAGYFAVVTMLRPAGVAAVDLYDLSSLYRHGHDQLRLALVWLGGLSLFVAVMLFDPNPAVQLNSFKVAAPILATMVLLGLLLILLPLRRIWIAIRTAKASALSSVMAELRALRASPGGVPGKEADLLARRAYFAALPEWPFDASSVGTFAFYVLLPFLTWAVGALAKQLLDTVFVAKAIKIILSAPI
jgi:hypothetical protein